MIGKQYLEVDLDELLAKGLEFRHDLFHGKLCADELQLLHIQHL